MARTLLAAGLVPVMMLGACAGPLNHEKRIGDAETGLELNSINPDAPRPYAQGGLYDGSPWSRPAGSLTGIDRENWAQQDFLVPIDGTSHQPLYIVHPDYANELARERGLYPDATTALELRGENTNTLQALEALAAPFYSGLDMVLWIPRAVMTPPNATVQSPGSAYERSPRLTETWVAASSVPPSPVVPEAGPTPEPATTESYPEPAQYEEPPAPPAEPAPAPSPAPAPAPTPAKP